MKNFFALLLLLVGGMLFPACQERRDHRVQSPTNFILITLDTVRQDHLSLYGYYRDTSPALSELARDSVLFTRAYTPLPSTWPAHFALMSSRSPASLGVLQNGQEPTDPNFPRLALHLKVHGFATAAIVGSDVFKSPGGLEAGFDLFENHISHNRKRPRRTLPNQYARGADEVVDLAVKWIGQRNPKQPFFLWMHFWDAHGPYYSPPEYLNRYQTDDQLRATMRERNQAPTFTYLGQTLATDQAINQYDGGIRFVNDELSRFFKFLREEGLYESSLIVVTADHGEGLMEHGIYIHGPVIYQTSVLIPLIIHLPGNAQAGGVISELVNLLDLAPTALSLLGLPPLPGSQGENLRPLIEGKAKRNPERRFWLESVNKPEKGELAPERQFGLVNQSWKFIRLESGTEFLFNLEQDPHELHNLVSFHPPELSHFRDLFQQYYSEYRKNAQPGRELSPEMKRALKSLGY